MFESMDVSAAKPPRWAIGRGTYFVWWMLENILGFACLRAIDRGQRLYVSGGDPNGTTIFIFILLAISTLLSALIIRLITVILRLRDFGASAWVSIVAFIPISNLIVDGFLIFKPGARSEG